MQGNAALGALDTSNALKKQSIADFVDQKNADKLIFTAGPAALLSENITGLRPCFGRGDADYAAVETRVLTALKVMSGHSNIVRMQGSASLALEIMALNFLSGRVLIIDSGYYAHRLWQFAESAARRQANIREVCRLPFEKLHEATGHFDWVWACSTETSVALKIAIPDLRATANRLKARLMLDATASIGLETHHELAEAIAYSSCKGLFGLTGAAFIAHHDIPQMPVDSFYLSLESHQNKMMTGPYHAIASLDHVLSAHADFRASVVENKKVFMAKMAPYLTRQEAQQPLLCTHVSCAISSQDSRAILYTPRSNLGGSVVCHLGEAHLGRSARGNILSSLAVSP